jgi:hypothetical protein
MGFRTWAQWLVWFITFVSPLLFTAHLLRGVVLQFFSLFCGELRLHAMDALGVAVWYCCRVGPMPAFGTLVLLIALGCINSAELDAEGANNIVFCASHTGFDPDVTFFFSVRTIVEMLWRCHV